MYLQIKEVIVNNHIFDMKYVGGQHTQMNDGNDSNP